MDKHQANQRIDELMRREQAALLQMSYRQLVDLPAHAQQPVNVAGREAILSTWRDLLPDPAVRLVTQYYQPGPLGSARVRAVGFVMDPGGAVRNLGESELWDFT